MGDKVKAAKNRISWIDTLKFLGIFSIYYGHFLDVGGRMHKFAFAYSVQLFFFASGFFALSHKDAPFMENLKKRIKTILLPYFIFSILTIIVIGIVNGISLDEVKMYMMQTLFGIRNKTPAPALWFLPCFFLMSVLYDCLYKIIKREWVLGIISVIFFILAATLIHPVENPRWIFNLDSVLYYMIFYAAGSLTFPFLKKDWKDFSPRNRIIIDCIMLLSVCISLLIYFQKILPIYQALLFIPGFNWMYPSIAAFMIIIFMIILAHLLQKIDFFQYIGKKTLYLCGNEYIIKLLFPFLAGLLGITIQITYPWHVLIYSIVLLFINSYIIVPIEEKLFDRLFH